MILLLAAAANLFSATTPNLSGAETSAEKAAMVQSVQKVASGGGGGGEKGVTDVMIISPAERANDIVQAFNYIQSHDVTSKVEVKLKNGSKINDILNIQMMPSGTLLIFKIQTLKGEVYRIVKIENIAEVEA
ncbi:MAG: hypothetical protein SP1CHLAM54_13970 [Chlamydiia bacterium]|nr:hypothetical protein [Chlamydiia bacterium]MCH9616289.1 hypothetical protein [Chlamydiia bacterium]MCH9629725.1 hypothetical protein [Chlamydiia bacterium]